MPDRSAAGAPTTEPARKLAQVWERVTCECVVCPDCAFTFGAEHVTQATGEYDCPECGATSRAEAGT